MMGTDADLCGDAVSGRAARRDRIWAVIWAARRAAVPWRRCAHAGAPCNCCPAHAHAPARRRPQVVLWSACLLSSSAGAATADSLAGHGYLQRETVRRVPAAWTPLRMKRLPAFTPPPLLTLLPAAPPSPPQGNLKCFASGRSSAPLPALFDELQLQSDLHLEWEHWYQQQQLENLNELTCSLHQKSELGQLRALLLVSARAAAGAAAACAFPHLPLPAMRV